MNRAIRGIKAQQGFLHRLTRYCLLAIISLLAALSVSTCYTNITMIDYRLSTESPTSFSDEKEFHLWKGRSDLKIGGYIIIEAGEVTVNVLSLQDKVSLFTQTYYDTGGNDKPVEINLKGLSSEEKYLLDIKANGVKELTLKLRSCDIIG